eukprot:607303_1
MKDESAGIPLQVCLRVRPSSDGSTDHFKICSNSDKKDDSILILAPEESSAFRNGERGEVRFSFSTIFGPNDDQQKIFASLGPTIIENLLNGQNGLVFAYGMTNSGKTYTIDGSSENPGFLPSLLSNHSNNYPKDLKKNQKNHPKWKSILAETKRRSMFTCPIWRSIWTM